MKTTSKNITRGAARAAAEKRPIAWGEERFATLRECETAIAGHLVDTLVAGDCGSVLIGDELIARNIEVTARVLEDGQDSDAEHTRKLVSLLAECAGFLATVRSDRWLKDAESGDLFLGQTVPWVNGAKEIAERATALLTAHDAREGER